MRKITMGLLLCLAVSCLFAAEWKPAGDKIKTEWAEKVDPANPLPEYPRPQMVRKDWKSLNGLWDYAISGLGVAHDDVGGPASLKWEGQILVPFCVESSLSGVQKSVGPKQKLWCRRTFTVDEAWKGKTILLHFEAVDWHTVVRVNGELMGEHKGGYDPFSFDITDALKAEGENTLTVSVIDTTDADEKPLGKQVAKPHAIWYTAVTGIWQPVWLEPVEKVHIDHIDITPDLTGIRCSVFAPQGDEAIKGKTVHLTARIGDRVVVKGVGKAGKAVRLNVPEPRLWSPEDPFLYDLDVELLDGDKVVDSITSYFGLRTTSVRKADGMNRLFLNGKPIFQFGPLDQGWWPDGLHTAPTDEALKFDIEWTKASGFNMIRKHVKVEPRRWYYWCDKLGMLVWQDMPSGRYGKVKWDRNVNRRGPGLDGTFPEHVKQQFRAELKAMVDNLYNAPSIVAWVPFNECWGQHDTVDTVKWIKQRDRTRPVNSASGGNFHNVGDILDVHSYPNPAFPRRDARQAVVCGEFGGLGLPVKGHLWWEKNWGYRTYKSNEQLVENYTRLIDMLGPMIARGLAAAIYTQTTDVEGEVNGLLTYDRKVKKMTPEFLKKLHSKLYEKHEIGFRYPATPLITMDPFTSCWTTGDYLYDSMTQHWTGPVHGMCGLIRIDGVTKRFMSTQGSRLVIPQKSVKVTATRTIYTFADSNVELKVTFTSPLLMDNLDLMSRPVSYVDFEVTSADGKDHDVQLYFDATSEWAVNKTDEKVTWSRMEVPGQAAMKMGTVAQRILKSKGDNHRINWGHVLLSTPKDDVQSVISDVNSQRGLFAKGGSVAKEDDPSVPRAAKEKWPGMSLVLNLGKVGETTQKRHVLIGYDDIESIQYFGKNLKAWWKRDGLSTEKMLEAAEKEHDEVIAKCEAFDAQLRADTERVGGEKYADVCELVYRQAIAAHKLAASPEGKPLFFSKETFSNGSIGTVDVTYPSSPMFLLYNPDLVKGMMEPIFYYSESGKWKKPIAAHDVGTYPIANGQTYGKDMPVEECGNMLILAYAIAVREGNADYAKSHWKVLTQWKDFLEQEGYDPDDQICTDDFAGHLAHNCNLSIKAIVAIASYGKLAGMQGDKETEKKYLDMAKDMAGKWEKEANDGDHYRLAFDKAETWSQKYNLAWDTMLGLNLFDPKIAEKEVAYYIKNQNVFGIPLDNRRAYTKSDWIMWSATLAKNGEDFRKLTDPVWLFVAMTTRRVPVCDWHETHSSVGKNFAARSVVGGYYMKLLADRLK